MTMLSSTQPGQCTNINKGWLASSATHLAIVDNVIHNDIAALHMHSNTGTPFKMNFNDV